ncbi:hypothetical protein [Pseudomonas capsici]|uniref:hypothetical protein n=1 Tax=Pseudomonas capsici TaxID=2810614 RepID=UPI0021F1F108|nr:hypothetical protein [Pseudomonas capsici]MCV4283199.1 hypothetical protein [Pseudomonas capsici]
MSLLFRNTATNEVQNKVESLVEWSVTGRQFKARLRLQGISLLLDAQPIESDEGTHFSLIPASGENSSASAAPAEPTPTICVNLRTLALQSIGLQSATILHELFHAVHHHLDPISYKKRKHMEGVVTECLGGWVALGGHAEEQLAITGYCVNLKQASPALQRWLSDDDQDVGFVGPNGTSGERVSLGPFCENRVLRHLGLPLRNSHGKPGEVHATPDVSLFVFKDDVSSKKIKPIPAGLAARLAARKSKSGENTK